MTAVEQIFEVTPLIRMRLGRNGKYPVVRFVPGGEKAAAGVCIAAPKGDGLGAAVEAVTAAIGKAGGMPKAVWAEGVGLFGVIDDTASLSGRVAGKAAVVTGAAQGFGLEIAQALAEQGARVCLADVNEAGVKAAAEGLQKQYGANRAMAVKMNVMDLVSIRDALRQMVLNFGGLDVFISNAGVLKAESVKTQSEKDFDFVTNVNYKGFFLCTQAVAPILAAQHAADPEAMSAIIQINSKSGLQGSNKNGAYAGSKFGGVGLVQSFAMELIADGVKVNAICPGNFFDGPLWSDPNNGLFVQYLRTGKIPGAKTIAEVKRAYEQKVPMGRGCMTDDVMKAVYYIMEQRYETGQAVPVTGGQVMLH